MVILSHPTQLFFEGTMFFIVFPFVRKPEIACSIGPTIGPTWSTLGTRAVNDGGVDTRRHRPFAS